MILIIDNNINIHLASKSFRSWCKKALTIVNPEFEQAVRYGRFTRGLKRNIRLYIESGEVLIVPRGFLNSILSKVEELGEPPPDVVEDLPEVEYIDIKSNITLRDYQKPFVESILNGGSGIAVASPGSGKTQCGLEVISKLKTKALWITHTSSLAKQTSNRIKECLSGCSLGLIGQGTFKVGDITVALVQTLIRRDTTDIEKLFSTIIVDEVHHAPSKSFTEVIRKFHYQRCIGLSATPYRRDRLEPLMYNIIGPKIAEVEKETLIDTGHIIPARVIQKQTGITIIGEEYRDILRSIYRNKERIHLICKDIMAENKQGNICIALTNKIDYGRSIVERLNYMGVAASLVFSTEVSDKDTRITMPKKERELIISDFISGKINVLVATYNLLSEGFDHKPLNRLFLTTPISDKNRTLLEQTCGRVERSCEGKKDALVYDYVDNHSLLRYQADMRIDVYECSGMIVSQE